jgi:hypothetical protein
VHCGSPHQPRLYGAVSEYGQLGTGHGKPQQVLKTHHLLCCTNFNRLRQCRLCMLIILLACGVLTYFKVRILTGTQLAIEATADP